LPSRRFIPNLQQNDPLTKRFRQFKLGFANLFQLRLSVITIVTSDQSIDACGISQ
jgi:hypothetical protein